MRVRLRSSAAAYLRKETTYLTRHSPSAAGNLVLRIKEARRNLSRFPEIGYALDSLPVSEIRRLIVGDYVLDYELTSEEVFIVAIRHGKQLPLEMRPDEDSDYEN